MPFLETILLSANNSKSRVSFADAPLFRIIYFLSDLFISNAHVLFHFLSLNTVQKLHLPILNLEMTISSRCTLRIHLNTCGRKLSSRPFCVWKKWAQIRFENKSFQICYLWKICTSKTIKIWPNQHTYLLRLLFTENSWKIKTDPEDQFQGTFFIGFFDEQFCFLILNKRAKFHYQAEFNFLLHIVKFVIYRFLQTLCKWTSKFL